MGPIFLVSNIARRNIKCHHISTDGPHRSIHRGDMGGHSSSSAVYSWFTVFIYAQPHSSRPVLRCIIFPLLEGISFSCTFQLLVFYDCPSSCIWCLSNAKIAKVPLPRLLYGHSSGTHECKASSSSVNAPGKSRLLLISWRSSEVLVRFPGIWQLTTLKLMCLVCSSDKAGSFKRVAQV